MLTFWADSLIDHDEKPRELNVLSHGQRDLWDNHQGCLEQKVICAHAHSQSHGANTFCTQQNESYRFTSRSRGCGWTLRWARPDLPLLKMDTRSLRAQQFFTRT